MDKVPFALSIRLHGQSFTVSNILRTQRNVWSNGLQQIAHVAEWIKYQTLDLGIAGTSSVMVDNYQKVLADHDRTRTRNPQIRKSGALSIWPHGLSFLPTMTGLEPAIPRSEVWHLIH